MANQVNVWRLANTYLKDFGEDAEMEAALFGESLLRGGDPDAHAVYGRVVDAIRELKRSVPTAGDTIN